MIDHTKQPSMDAYKHKIGQPKSDRTPEPRVITLSPNSLRFLSSIGVLQQCNENYVTDFYEMLVYEEFGKGYMKFDSKHQKE